MLFSTVPRGSVGLVYVQLEVDVQEYVGIFVWVIHGPFRCMGAWLCMGVLGCWLYDWTILR